MAAISEESAGAELDAVLQPVVEDDRPHRSIYSRHRGWVLLLVSLDAAAVAIAALAALVAKVGLSPPRAASVGYYILAAALVPAWLVALAVTGTYDRRHLSAGAEQYRRILSAAVWMLAFLGFASFAVHADVSRGFILTALPSAGVLTLIERYGARKALHYQFARGLWMNRVMTIGAAADVRALADHMRRAAFAGYEVVAAVTPRDAHRPMLPPGVDWLGSDFDRTPELVRAMHVDAVVITGPHTLDPGQLRRLSWTLEGSDVELVVAPALTDLAGPRIRVRPVDGLPLLHIDKPEFAGGRRLIKAVMDRTAAAILLLVLAPLLTACAIGVKISSRGPVLFRQQRLGLHGESFRVLKFRSMWLGSDGSRGELESRNDADGGLFKMRVDPRVTRFGRFLRRWSLDELPQLFNVLGGSMSLVGPRPLPVTDMAGRLEGDVHRRALVKPGITGLWQISGRSDLPWEECVRLDLYYVENWSVALDLQVLCRTVIAVLRARGAY